MSDIHTKAQRLADLGRERYGTRRTYLVTLSLSAAEFAYLQRVCTHQQWSYRQWVEHAMCCFNSRVQRLQGLARLTYLQALYLWSPPAIAQSLQCRVYQAMFEEQVSAFVQPHTPVRLTTLLRWVLWTEMDELLARPPAPQAQALRWEARPGTAASPSLENPLPALLNLFATPTPSLTLSGVEPLQLASEAAQSVSVRPEAAQPFEQPESLRPRRQEMLQQTRGTRRTHQVGLSLSAAELDVLRQVCAHQQWSYRQCLEDFTVRFTQLNSGPKQQECTQALAAWTAPAPTPHLVTCMIHEHLHADCMRMLPKSMRLTKVVRWILHTEAANILATPPTEQRRKLPWQTAQQLKELVNGSKSDDLANTTASLKQPSETPQLMLGASKALEPLPKVVQPVSTRPEPTQAFERPALKLDFPSLPLSSPLTLPLAPLPAASVSSPQPMPFPTEADYAMEESE